MKKSINKNQFGPCERCVTEGLEALRVNRAVYIPGQLNRIMNRLVPPSVAQKMEAKMLKK